MATLIILLSIAYLIILIADFSNYYLGRFWVGQNSYQLISSPKLNKTKEMINAVNGWFELVKSFGIRGDTV